MIDLSCAITSSSTTSNEDTYVGGIIGKCDSSIDSCAIESIINMGRITFNGNISTGSLYIGGIAGYLRSYKQKTSIKNCANYGSVSHIGTSRILFIGGIAGFSDFRPSLWRFIQNCLNYGAILNNNTESGNQYIGGIAGRAIHLIIENCVSAGKIS